MFDFGILGMNARNLQYIKKRNPRKAIRLADNKLKTKEFLSARGIPVPQTYGHIKTASELATFDFSGLPQDDFIIKPNKGSRGRGIYRVHLAEQTTPIEVLETKLNRWDRWSLRATSPHHHQRYRVSGKTIDDTTLRRYLTDILDGKNSISTTHDTILLEEVLLPGLWFEQYCSHGLADIRVIVFNLVPVWAMLRIPTAASDGKANLAKGAVGMWVEVGNGRLYALYDQGNVYHENFPAPYGAFIDQTLPFWDEILLHSSYIQYFANLWFIALDRVITDEWPKLLEINARAGLKIQNATLVRLKERLLKVTDLKVTTPEKWVAIAQTLFSSQKSPTISPSKVIYLSQYGVVQRGKKMSKQRFDVIVSVALQKNRNYLAKELYEIWKASGALPATVVLWDQQAKIPDLIWHPLPGDEKNKVVLGKEAISDFYLKPIEKIKTAAQFLDNAAILKNELDELHILDEKITEISHRLNLSKLLRPTNYAEQLDLFISAQGKYNPQFRYARPSATTLERAKDGLQRLHDTYFKNFPLQSQFAQLYAQKIIELQHKVALLEAYSHQDYVAIEQGNRVMYGAITQPHIDLSLQSLTPSHGANRRQLWRVLKKHEVEVVTKKYLHEQWLPDVVVRFTSEGYGRMSVIKGKRIIIKIAINAGIREKELLASLAHEVDVHIKRYLAAKQSWWRLLMSGTAGYMTDEEGLALLHSERYLPTSYEKMGMYRKYLNVSQSASSSFLELAQQMKAWGKRSLVGIFKGVLRVKKWLQDTSHTGLWTTYYKDKIYLDGYLNVRKRIEQWGDESKLMMGKIKIADLPLLGMSEK